MQTTEIIAAILGAISVWLVVKRNVWAFPIGILMVIIYAWIFYEAKLYSDMLLQCFFVVMQVQGWIHWNSSAKGGDEKIEVRSFLPVHWVYTLVFQVLGTLGLGFLMQRYTDAALPWPDAFATVLSISAQWWMNKRYLENWILWISVDVLYLYIYFSKALYATTVLYAIFLGMAIIGLRTWQKNTLRPGRI